MRFICTLLIGLITMSSVGAAQSLQSSPNRLPQGWSRPSGQSITPQIPRIIPQGPTIIPPTIQRSCPKGTLGKWPYCVSVKAPKCPNNTLGKSPNCRAIARNCPKGMIGKWPDCRALERPHCPQGTTGDWPNCVEIAKPTDKSCPEGQVRKGKRCIELSQGGGSGTTKPPSTAKTPKKEAFPPAITALTANRPHRPREILVLVDASHATEIATRLARQYNVSAEPRVLVPLLEGAVVRLRLKGNRSLESLLSVVSADPDVKLAQPNYDYRAGKGPDLPQDVPQYANEKIRLEEAHRVANGEGVMVAMIDTAVDATHPELIGAIAGVFDAVETGSAPAEPHGTEIAGILVAHARLAGVAPDAKLLSVRAFRGGSSGPAQSTTLQLLKGVDWAFHAGARIVNMSFSGPMDPLLERVLKAAAGKGVIFIAAAGNNGPNAPPAYPAAYPDVIAVTATDEKDSPYTKDNQGEYIFMAAPGVDIIGPTLKGAYELASGTSMAAAYVSGAVALMLERSPKLDIAQVREILAASARRPSGSISRNLIGAGILDAAGAVSACGGAEGVAAPPVATGGSTDH